MDPRSRTLARLPVRLWISALDSYGVWSPDSGMPADSGPPDLNSELQTQNSSGIQTPEVQTWNSTGLRHSGETPLEFHRTPAGIQPRPRIPVEFQRNSGPIFTRGVEAMHVLTKDTAGQGFAPVPQQP